MYYYIYDSFVADRKYDRVMAAVETRLTDLGISGKIGRLTPFTNARGLVRDETRRGVKTIVAVGNDETVAKVVGGLGEADVTLGIIPVGGPSAVAESLGIPPGAEACDILSQRLTQKIDLGRINGQYFLSLVRVPPGDYTVEGEGGFRISAPVVDSEIVISNVRGADTAFEMNGRRVGDPQDGLLDVLVLPQAGKLAGAFRGNGADGSSVFPLRKLTISHASPVTVFVDSMKMESKQFAIEIAPGRLKVITGRERLFADK